jgi:hypothetical protein
MDLSARISLLATRIANYLRDSVIPRLLPSGGNTGQVLSKSSGTDYAVSWVTHKTVQYSIQIGASSVRLLKPLVVTIYDTDVTALSKIEAWYSPITNAAQEEFEDDAEFDYLDVRVIPSSITTGSFKVAISTRNNGLVNNQKTIMYRVQN